MAHFYDISNWNPQPYFNTGGTRNKKYVQGPDGSYYFFKTSYANYKYEFWSEIIAYELGEILGLDVLPYYIAIDRNTIGCLSKSMLIAEKEQLLEGGKYLKAMDNTFNPDDRKLRNKYSFELIEAAIHAFDLRDHFESLYGMMVFDALIGNSDRHQENWAFIGEPNRLIEDIAKGHERIKERTAEPPPPLSKYIYDRLVSLFKPKDKAEADSAVNLMQLLNTGQMLRFSPYYDNGSSLGRELEDEKVSRMLRNPAELEAYALRGKSEIHWGGEKLKHLHFMELLFAHEGHGKAAADLARLILSKFKENEFEEILQNIDILVPVEFSKYRLPKERKEVILKIVSLRAGKLKALLK